MRPVFGDILISFGVVWYSGMRKWYAGFSLVVAAVGVVPGAKPCKSAGITRVYPGFSPEVYPQNTRCFADLADFGPKPASDSAQSPKFDDFHGVFPGKERGKERVL